eukprot:c20631_g1_i3 orf=132-653(+)
MASSFLIHHSTVCRHFWSVRRPTLLQQRRPSLVVVRAKADEEGRSSRVGERLWRSELSSSSWSDESFLKRSEEDQAEEEEKERQRSRKVVEDEKGGAMQVVASLVEKLLVADFFFILLILVWFVAGLAEKGAFDTSSLIDAWFPLWPTLFQPALGFFMAGSLWTAVSKNWLKK